MNSVYYHPGQQRSILAGAKTEYLVCGRGWGKSESVGAKRTSDWANAMPRGSIGIVGATYMQLLDRTLPPLYRGWERLGYRRGVHYWPRQKPPKELRIKLPFYAPDTDKNTIYWWNGACFKLISQDRPGSANGTTLDGLYGDEAKLLNKTKFDDEISKANRGNVREFGRYGSHHGVLFMTDMPTTPDAKWILDKVYDLQLDIKKSDTTLKMQKLLQVIIAYQVEINKLIYARYQETNPAKLKKLNRAIFSSQRRINELRRGTVNYTNGPSTDNIHFLGLDTLKDWKRDDLDVTFRTQVLNERLYQVTNAFYPHFDPALHCDTDYNYGYVESLGLYLPEGVIKDSRVDSDCRSDEPIDIGMDTGSSINCMVTGQSKPDHYRFLKSLFVKKPKLITDVTEDYCEYYKHHRCKVVNFFYDNTFVGTDGTRILHQADMVTQVLTKHGWTVRQHYIGQQPEHDSRYRMWNNVMQGGGEGAPPVSFNRDNCSQLIISIQCTGAMEKIEKRTGRMLTMKDKRPEHRDIPQEEAPHLTDAMDTLYVGKHRHTLGYTIPVASAYFGEQAA